MDTNNEASEKYRTIALSGRLNFRAADLLKEAVSSSIASGSTSITLEMAGAESLDSTFLGALVWCVKEARQAGGDLRIVRPCHQVADLLERTNLARFLTAYDSAADAYPQ